MPVISGTSSTQVNVQDSPTSVEIYNISVVNADTEYSQALPANTKRFLLRSRNGYQLKLSYDSGESGTLFVTLNGGCVYEDINFYSLQTLYFQSPVAGGIVEVVVFY